MKRPHSVAGMFAAALVLWLLSVVFTLVTVFTGIDPAAGYTGQSSLPIVFAAVAAIGSSLFFLWTGWRACRALDYLVHKMR